MQKKVLILVIFLLTISLCGVSYSGSLSYDYLTELAKDYLSKGLYDDAIHYFNMAHLVSPLIQEPLFYINLTKRLKDGRIKDISYIQKESSLIQKESLQAQKESLPIKSESLLLKREILEVQEEKPKIEKSTQSIVSQTLDLFEIRKSLFAVPEKIISRSDIVSITLDEFEPKRLVRSSPKIEPKKDRKSKKIISFDSKTLKLEDDMFSNQPIRVELERRSSLFLVGKNIKRFVATNPDLLIVERINENKISINSSAMKGATFLQLWDARGRWTIDLRVMSSTLGAELLRQSLVEELAKPFRFTYSLNWSTYYRGNELSSMEKSSLSMRHHLQAFGETPYGDLDGAAIFNKFDQSTELISYSLGLSNGKIWNFRDFNIRVFDIYEILSPFSLPGSGMRGVSLKARAFNETIAYSLFRGKRRTFFGGITAGVIDNREEILEGGKITFFPKNESNFSFNYAQGSGSARSAELKDRVYSIEGQQRLGPLKLSSEVASDEEKIAARFTSLYMEDDLTLRFSLRNIEKNFTTLTGNPSGQGEIGGVLGFDYRFDSDLNLSSNLEVYRDRTYFNPGSERDPNYDWNISAFKPLTDYSSLRSSFYYTYTPGFVSPRRTLRLDNIYSRRFQISDKKASWFLRNNYQRSRSMLSSSSDYNRYGLGGGFGISLTSNLYYRLNYDYSYVQELVLGENTSPRSLSTSINYNKRFSPNWFSNLGLTYRNESATSGSNSFLSGEDSMIANLNLTYRPSADFEFFLGSNLTKTRSEITSSGDYASTNIRLGMRSSWDLPFRWNPKGTIKGVVFEDLDGDGKQSFNEDGIPDVKINIGKKSVLTNYRGEYGLKVSAKKATVSIETETIPEGHIFSTDTSHEVEIMNFGTNIVDFGLTTQSGIYGVVFYDKNNNGRPDLNDEFVKGVKITLDKKNETITDMQGSYFFRGIVSGEHTIILDVNSIPIDYLPKIKIKSNINLKDGTTYIFHIPLVKK